MLETIRTPLPLPFPTCLNANPALSSLKWIAECGWNITPQRMLGGTDFRLNQPRPSVQASSETTPPMMTDNRHADFHFWRERTNLARNFWRLLRSFIMWTEQHRTPNSNRNRNAISNYQLITSSERVSPDSELHNCYLYFTLH